MMRGASIAERLEAYSVPEPNTGCVLWTGARQKRSGYGQIQIGDRSRLAHRVSKANAGYSVPEGSAVRHTCDTPACINPEHLVVGTQHENIRDRDQKNRQSRGRKVYTAKLTDEIVRRIRQEQWSIERVQEETGLSYRAAKSAVRGKSWKHV